MKLQLALNLKKRIAALLHEVPAGARQMQRLGQGAESALIVT